MSRGGHLGTTVLIADSLVSLSNRSSSFEDRVSDLQMSIEDQVPDLQMSRSALTSMSRYLFNRPSNDPGLTCRIQVVYFHVIGSMVLIHLYDEV